MTKFDLDNFKKADKPKIRPAWAESGPPVTTKLYDAACELIEVIEKRIKECKTKTLSINDRKLVNAHIAERAGLSKTNLRKDRQPKLLEFIDIENERLASLWVLARSHSSDGRKHTKSEIEQKYKEILKENKQLKNDNLAEFFQEALKSEVLNEQKNLAAAHKQLKADYQSALETIANLRKANADLLRQLNRL